MSIKDAKEHVTTVYVHVVLTSKCKLLVRELLNIEANCSIMMTIRKCECYIYSTCSSASSLYLVKAAFGVTALEWPKELDYWNVHQISTLLES